MTISDGPWALLKIRPRAELRRGNPAGKSSPATVLRKATVWTHFPCLADYATPLDVTRWSPRMTDQPYRSWTNHAGGHFKCSHMGCSKKVNPAITEHDCCGRCRQGRDCLRDAQNNYDGPGSFYHSYWEFVGPLRRPGVCATCGEPPEAH